MLVNDTDPMKLAQLEPTYLFYAALWILKFAELRTQIAPSLLPPACSPFPQSALLKAEHANDLHTFKS